MLNFDWNNQNNKTTKLVNDIQLKFDCCGGYNASESWQQLRPSDVPLGAYPLTCCEHELYDDSISQWCDEQQVKNQVILAFNL